MGTVSCDTEAINSTVIPPLGASCEYLGEALEIINSIEIPSGLSINIKDASSRISGVITEVTSIESWIWAVVSKFNQAEKNNNDLIKKIIDAQAKDVDLPQGNFQMSDSLNLAIAFSKGLAGFGENLLDALVIVATNVANTGEFVGGEFKPYEVDKIGKVIGYKQREEIMNFVANDHVGDAYNKFYKNSDIGKWLDYSSNEIFKSDGIGSNIASGIGNVTGIAGLTILTGGTSIFTSAAIAGTTATGKYTGEYWANARDEASSAGKDWATEDVQNKGMLYGLANGTWEAAQWYVGGKLNNLNIQGVSKFANSATRVGIDTAFNALDTPYRTLIDVATSDKTMQEAWDNRGGWESFITDVGIGLIGTVGGEVIDHYTDKIKNSLFQKAEMSMDEKINQAKKEMNEYWDKHIGNNGRFEDWYRNSERIQDTFDKIVVCENDESFEKILHDLCDDLSDEEIRNIGAFHYFEWNNEKIFLRPSNSTETIIHEVNHGLGEVDVPEINCRGIDEAFTESLSLRIHGVKGNGNSGYNFNVGVINKVFSIMEDAGISRDDIDYYYYSCGGKFFEYKLNKLANDDSFFKDLAENMDIADGLGKIRDEKAIKTARREIDGLLDYLERKVGEVN